MGSYVGLPNCCRVPSFECVCHIPVPTVGLEVVFRGGVHTPPSAPGFRNRCPSRRLVPELGAHLQNVKRLPPPIRNPTSEPRHPVPGSTSGPTIGRRRRNAHSQGAREPSFATRCFLIWARMRAAGFVVRAQHSECGAQSRQTQGMGNAVELPPSGSEFVQRVLGSGLRCRGPNASANCWY